MIYRALYPMNVLTTDDFENQSLESMFKIFKTMKKVIITENLNSVVSKELLSLVITQENYDLRLSNVFNDDGTFNLRDYTLE